MLNNIKYSYGKGKTILENVTNFLGDIDNFNKFYSISGSATVENLTCKIQNDIYETQTKYSCCIESKSFNINDFQIIEITLEGMKSSNSAILDFSISDCYGISLEPLPASTNYISLNDNKLYGKINNNITINETLTYNISSDITKLRNITFRIDIANKTIECLEDGQVLINKKVSDDVLAFVDPVHFKIKITNNTDNSIITEFKQIKTVYYI